MLAKTYLLLGAPGPAQYHFDQLTRSLVDSGGSDLIRADAEIGLAWTALDLDRLDAVRYHAERAANIYRRIGNSSGLEEVICLREALEEVTGPP